MGYARGGRSKALSDNGILPPDSGRYTLDGDESVESRIDHDQQLIADAVQALVDPAAFRALVLMGGYGRGEGGYVMHDGKPFPYNDYDYFLVVHGLNSTQREQLNHKLADQAKLLEERVGVEVDFALLREERLPDAEYSLMNAEMIWGHRVVAGEPRVLEAMPAMPFSRLPMGEFTRLMLNRGSLLLMNQLGLSEGNPGAAQLEVFFKYLFKAVLACGDARLAAKGRYHPSYPKKLELLQSMEWRGKDEFMGLYSQALEHKFHPEYSGFLHEDAAAWQQQVVAVWLDTLSRFETERTGNQIESWNAYCAPQLSKGQQSSSGLRNLAVTLRDFGPMQLVTRPLWSLRYPRERLISVLPLLLKSPDQDARLPSCVTDALALPRDADWTRAVERFLQLWQRYA